MSGQRIAAKVTDGGEGHVPSIEIPIIELVEALSPEGKADLARFLTADALLFANVLECVVTGHYNTDDADGSWWFGSEETLRLREKLVPLMSEIAAGALKEALRQRDVERSLKDRLDRWAWEMYHAWPEHYWKARPNLPDWVQPDWAAKREVCVMVPGHLGTCMDKSFPVATPNGESASKTWCAECGRPQEEHAPEAGWHNARACPVTKG